MANIIVVTGNGCLKKKTWCEYPLGNFSRNYHKLLDHDFGKGILVLSRTETDERPKRVMYNQKLIKENEYEFHIIKDNRITEDDRVTEDLSQSYNKFFLLPENINDTRLDLSDYGEMLHDLPNFIISVKPMQNLRLLQIIGVFLDISNIRDLPDVLYPHDGPLLPNLHALDLRHNKISVNKDNVPQISVDALTRLLGKIIVDLRGNPISSNDGMWYFKILEHENQTSLYNLIFLNPSWLCEIPLFDRLFENNDVSEKVKVHHREYFDWYTKIVDP